MYPFIKKASEYDQEIPKAYSANQPTAYVKHVNPGEGEGDNLWPHGHSLNKKANIY